MKTINIFRDKDREINIADPREYEERSAAQAFVFGPAKTFERESGLKATKESLPVYEI